MNFVREPKGIQEFLNDCELSGQNVVWRQKKINECVNVYRNNEAVKDFGDQLAYKVANQNFNRENYVKGNLQWGITYINPFTVDGECAMTAGHYHGDTDCDEYYYGLKGEGFLLFWDGKDEFYAEKIFPGSLHYINGHYAHRIINSGDALLAVAACSLPASKQDHKAIEVRPFPYRCFKRDGVVVWEKETYASDPR
ncbi:MAG: glucose-6-phosphate isomerase family protein [Erysipelotrichaceae bacterium]